MSNFLEKRKADLEKKIQTQYDLLHQTEEQRDHALLPVEKQRLELEIKRIKTLIEGYETDYEEVSRKIVRQNFVEQAEAEKLKQDLEKQRLEEEHLAQEKAEREKKQRLEAQKTNEIFEINGVDFEMILVKGGKFMMGYDPKRDGEYADYLERSKPLHEVELDDYWIGKYLITQKQWQSIMSYNPSHFKGNNSPVEQVSWNDCQAFLNKLNQKTGEKFSLPSEAQWEYAARGGNKSKGFVYAGSNNLDEVAWYDKNSGKKTHEVGTKKPNELEIYDMSGNVWEWCLDGYDAEFYKKVEAKNKNPINNHSKNTVVLRGGSWGGYSNYCQIEVRFNYNPSSWDYFIGFRLCLGK